MNNPLKEFRPENLCLLKEAQEEYWRYSDSPQDFSIYSDKSNIYETPTKEKFRESSDVLVRWTDGLLYLATVIQVEDEYSRCAVKFEDGSQFWALYKDIYRGPLPDNEFACSLCDSSSSLPPDEIVICDKCAVGYHQLCHIPKINANDMNPDLQWHCRKCVFAAAAKKGGAIRKGTNGQAMMAMKETLPYDMQSLTWDTSHRTNLQQTYCYCGGPGEWYSKMLQCSRCRQWFHEACLQCLDDPLLFGDRHYIFVCSVCNKGPEFLRRLPLRWPDIAHLVLFNLTVLQGRKFFEFDTTIMFFLKENWSQFQLKGEAISRMSFEEKKKKLLDSLQKSKSRFTSAKDMKKKNTLWGLRSRIPPPIPVFTIPESGVITNDVLDSYNARKAKSVTKSNSLPSSVKRFRRSSYDLLKDMSKKNSPTRDEQRESIHVEKSNKKEAPKKKERRKLPLRLAKLPKPVIRMQNQNGLRQPSTRRRLHRASSIITISDSDDTSSSQGTLNSIIPHPTNFEGSNNPFLSTFKNGSTSADSKSSVESHSISAKVPDSQRVTSKNSIFANGQLRSSTKIADSEPKSLFRKAEINRNTARQKFSNDRSKNLECQSDIGSSDSCVQISSPTARQEKAQDDMPRNLLARNLLARNSILKKLDPRTRSRERALKLTSKIESRRAIKLRKAQKLRNQLSIQLRVRPTRKYTTSEPESPINQLLNQTDYKIDSDIKLKPSVSSHAATSSDLHSSVSSYFGVADRIANGEKFSVLAKRIGPDGKVQYLIEWESLNS